MAEQHSITIPPELIEKWRCEPEYGYAGKGVIMVTMTEDRLNELLSKSAKYGADEELKACIEWLGDAPVTWKNNKAMHPGSFLRDARRPKPPSLKEEAMQALCRFMAREGHDDCTEEEIEDDFNAIRRALEALPND